jgi:hypothetical protein
VNRSANAVIVFVPATHDQLMHSRCGAACDQPIAGLGFESGGPTLNLQGQLVLDSLELNTLLLA